MDVLNEEYIEAVTVPSSIPRFLDGTYAEALILPPSPPRTINTLYMEVVVSLQAPAPQLEGWGIPIN